MVQKETVQQFNAEYYNQEKFLDLATKKIIVAHLSDINNKITEEDIKNVKTDIGITPAISSFLNLGESRPAQSVQMEEILTGTI